MLSFLLDAGAASSLTRNQHPWLVGSVDWTDELIRRAVTWLSRKLNKPVLKLLDEDYNEHGMSDLLTDCGPAYQLNIRYLQRAAAYHLWVARRQAR